MRYILITLLSLFVVGCSNEVKTEEYHGMIFQSSHNKLDNLITHESATQIDIKKDDVKKAEEIISKYVKGHNQSIYSKLSGYKRQYFGMIKDENLLLYVSFLMSASDNWKDGNLIVADGGDNYFQVLVNITTGEVIRFDVNGEA